METTVHTDARGAWLSRARALLRHAGVPRHGAPVDADATYLGISDRERLWDPSQRAKAHVAADAGGVRRGARVVDVGAGQGWHVAALSATYTVAGVEPSPGLRSVGRARLDALTHAGGAALRAGTAQRLPLADRTADLLLSLNTVLGYGTADDDAHALNEFARVLRPGAQLIVEVLAPDPAGSCRVRRMFPDGAVLLRERAATTADVRDEVEVLLRPDGRWGAFGYRVRVIAPERLERMARAAGLRDVRIAGDVEGAPWREGASTVLTGRAPL